MTTTTTTRRQYRQAASDAQWAMTETITNARKARAVRLMLTRKARNARHSERLAVLVVVETTGNTHAVVVIDEDDERFQAGWTTSEDEAHAAAGEVQEIVARQDVTLSSALAFAVNCLSDPRL